MTPPFAPGSISLRLYPHSDLSAVEIVHEMRAQARLALASGFDGVMTSEHHGGFAGYLPNPLQMTAFLLETHDTGWAAACPLLLPLRPVAQLAEEVAWLAARHPGRVGLGDLAGDQALRACAATPIPVLSAVMSPTAACRAAVCGAGTLSEGMSTVERVRALHDAYAEAGGTGTKMLIRRVWLGRPDDELIERQRAAYLRLATTGAAATADQTIVATDPTELAERIVDAWRASGADAINLRVHLPGVDARSASDQIAALAEQVLPTLRRLRRDYETPV